MRSSSWQGVSRLGYICILSFIVDVLLFYLYTTSNMYSTTGQVALAFFAPSLLLLQPLISHAPFLNPNKFSLPLLFVTQYVVLLVVAWTISWISRVIRR
jgi:hypothetical protein